MELRFAPKSMQMPMLEVPQKPAYRLVHRSTLFTSRKFRGQNLKLARCARFNDFSHADNNEKVYEKGGKRGIELNSSTQLLPSKIGFPDRYLLGIRPEHSDWPERDEIRRISIEQKANNAGIPLSLRIIKRRERWKEGFLNAGEFAYCSIHKAFSSLLFIIRELQNYTLLTKKYLDCEDLPQVMPQMQRDMTLTFVWLFQQVFSKTPTLMINVMVLLANFSVHSMTDYASAAGTQPPRFTQEAIAATMSLIEEESEGQSGSGLSTSVQHPDVVPDEIAETSFHAMADGEQGLWKLVVEEASRMQGELYHKVLDHQMRQQLVSPLSVQLEPDNYGVHFRTNLTYQMWIAEEPNNPLLLSNYARFVHLVIKDHDRAEEFFRRAIQVEPQDAEALGLYADFLWQVRNDHEAAEERYLQAVAADPKNPCYVSKYANFLWSAGGEGTCFPPSFSYDSYSKVP